MSGMSSERPKDGRYHATPRGQYSQPRDPASGWTGRIVPRTGFERGADLRFFRSLP